jgi:SulP family sulfate permease
MLFGALKLGKYITLMPYTVISGFMTGIGIILVILQTAPFLGHPNPPGGVLGTLRNLPNLLHAISAPETILGIITLAILFLTPKAVQRFVPSQLIALIVGTVLSLIVFTMWTFAGLEKSQPVYPACIYPILRLPNSKPW